MQKLVWKCGECMHANMSSDENALCYWCNGCIRLPMYPVKVPNMQQGTPSLEDLTDEINLEEANRDSDQSVESQIDALITRYFDERDKNTPRQG